MRYSVQPRYRTSIKGYRFLLKIQVKNYVVDIAETS